MVDEGGSVTLVFYKVGTGIDLLKEPFLNLVAAAAQRSSFSHVEIAIGKTRQSLCTPRILISARMPFAGSDAGNMGQISNVCRIFNDDVGVSWQNARSVFARILTVPPVVPRSS